MGCDAGCPRKRGVLWISGVWEVGCPRNGQVLWTGGQVDRWAEAVRAAGPFCRFMQNDYL